MKIILGIMMIFLSGVFADENFHIDRSKSFHVATVVDDTGNIRNWPYYRPYRRPYYRPYYQRKYHRKETVRPEKRYRYVPPRMTDEKRIQKALEGLGFYHGRIDGAVNSYATRSAIKKMNIAFGVGSTSSLDTKASNNLIFLGTQFILDGHLIAAGDSRQIKYKKIQAALRIHGFYHARIDGIRGDETRRAISEYKRDRGLPYGSSLNYEDEYQLISNAKKINDANIEDTIESLKSAGNPNISAPQQN